MELKTTPGIGNGVYVEAGLVLFFLDSWEWSDELGKNKNSGDAL